MPHPPSAHGPPRVAIVGAGIAGASSAAMLAAKGWAVQVFDKARGPGGRLATRRLAWTDSAGKPRSARVDHGAPGFAVGSELFRSFLRAAVGDGGIAPWTPLLAPGSRPVDPAGAWCLPVPDMPSLCRALLRELPVRSSFTVGGLRQDAAAWWVEGLVDGEIQPAAGPFDVVVLALPPAQAAPLLAPHRADWAHSAAQAEMHPSWTLMGVSRRPVPDPGWQVLCPAQGPLSWLHRDDLRPGRMAEADEAHWVAHAHAAWSRQNLEQPPDRVLQPLQDAVDAALHACGIEALAWQHVVVHRWRFAQAPVAGRATDDLSWWHASIGLGACGDFLGGGGVEGAWLSAQALVRAMSVR